MPTPLSIVPAAGKGSQSSCRNRIFFPSWIFLPELQENISALQASLLKREGEKEILFLCWGYQHKAPQTGWLTPQERIVSRFWRRQVQGQGVGRACFFRWPLERPFHAASLASAGGWHVTDRCLPVHMMFSWCVCVCVCLSRVVPPHALSCQDRLWTTMTLNWNQWV